jgi:hypothetical protein
VRKSLRPRRKAPSAFPRRGDWKPLHRAGLARLLPASKTGQLIVGPMDRSLLPRVNQSLALTLCKPYEPVSENFGKRSRRLAPWRRPFAARPRECRGAPEQVRRQADKNFRREFGNRQLETRDSVAPRSRFRPHPATHGILRASSNLCKENDHRPGFRPYGG